MKVIRTITIDDDLAYEAKTQGINLSKELNEALRIILHTPLKIKKINEEKKDLTELEREMMGKQKELLNLKGKVDKIKDKIKKTEKKKKDRIIVWSDRDETIVRK